MRQSRAFITEQKGRFTNDYFSVEMGMPEDMTLKWTAEPLKIGSGAQTANELRNASQTNGIELDEFELV